MFVGTADVVLDDVPFLKLVPFNAAEVFEAPDPTSRDRVGEGVELAEPERKLVAFEVTVAVSVKSVPNLVESVWELIDA